ncbi:MAG: helix-turn-helix domain-containing protein [Pseudonocardia sp.]
MDDDTDASIGPRLREVRAWRGLSQRAAAGLAGVSGSYLSMIENGQRPVDKRSTLEALAAALRVAPSELTGQPYAPVDRDQAEGHAAAPRLRAVLRDIELGESTVSGPPRVVTELRPEVDFVNSACAACDFGAIAEAVPSLIGELHVLGSGKARRMLAEVLFAAFYLAKDLGSR